MPVKITHRSFCWPHTHKQHPTHAPQLKSLGKSGINLPSDDDERATESKNSAVRFHTCNALKRLLRFLSCQLFGMMALRCNSRRKEPVVASRNGRSPLRGEILPSLWTRQHAFFFIDSIVLTRCMHGIHSVQTKAMTLRKSLRTKKRVHSSAGENGEEGFTRSLSLRRTSHIVYIQIFSRPEKRCTQLRRSDDLRAHLHRIWGFGLFVFSARGGQRETSSKSALGGKKNGQASSVLHVRFRPTEPNRNGDILPKWVEHCVCVCVSLPITLLLPPRVFSMHEFRDRVGTWPCFCCLSLGCYVRLLTAASSRFESQSICKLGRAKSILADAPHKSTRAAMYFANANAETSGQETISYIQSSGKILTRPENPSRRRRLRSLSSN